MKETYQKYEEMQCCGNTAQTNTAGVIDAEKVWPYLGPTCEEFGLCNEKKDGKRCTDDEAQPAGGGGVAVELGALALEPASRCLSLQ